MGDRAKDQIIANWEKKVLDKFGNSFELISVSGTKESGERTITVKCLTCGTVKAVSSISFRGEKGKNGHCDKCYIRPIRPEQIEKAKFKAAEHEIEIQRNKFKRNRKTIAKRLKEKQLTFGLCECGNLLSPNRKACDECKRKSARKRDERKETIRRLRVLDDFDPEVTLEWTINRYNNICYLCGKPCDDNDYQMVNGNFVVGSNYPTMEHFIPICKGGKHTKNNVKLAHHGCNSRKGRKSFENYIPLQIF